MWECVAYEFTILLFFVLFFISSVDERKDRSFNKIGASYFARMGKNG